MHCDPNAYCVLVPETSDFKCECKPGFNGTGMECIGAMIRLENVVKKRH